MTHATTLRPRSRGMRVEGSTPDDPTTTTLHDAYCVQPTHSVCCDTRIRVEFTGRVFTRLFHVQFYTSVNVTVFIAFIKRVRKISKTDY
jgi:hypothetical protein